MCLSYNFGKIVVSPEQNCASYSYMIVISTQNKSTYSNIIKSRKIHVIRCCATTANDVSKGIRPFGWDTRNTRDVLLFSPTTS